MPSFHPTPAHRPISQPSRPTATSAAHQAHQANTHAAHARRGQVPPNRSKALHPDLSHVQAQYAKLYHEWSSFYPKMESINNNPHLNPAQKKQQRHAYFQAVAKDGNDIKAALYKWAGAFKSTADQIARDVVTFNQSHGE